MKGTAIGGLKTPAPAWAATAGASQRKLIAQARRERLDAVTEQLIDDFAVFNSSRCWC